jgi:LDH2 family malate/lactate/ureidoglycolate dehydrogenase
LISEAASLDSVINPAELDKKQDVGHFMIGIDVSKLLSLSELNERVKDYKHRLKERGSQNGGEVLLPGEPEERLYKTVMKDGINVDSIPATVIAEIKGIASKYRITPPF